MLTDEQFMAAILDEFKKLGLRMANLERDLANRSMRPGYWCMNCGADLSGQSPTAPAHQCYPKWQSY